MAKINRKQYAPFRFREIARREILLEKRAFLDLVKAGWYIETAPCVDGMCQGGTVAKVIRDKYGIPVCFKTDGSDDTDWISADRVMFFEPKDEWVADCWDYMTEEEYGAFDDEAPEGGGG